MVKIKICGITNLDDARAAVEAGADMLGFNFYRPSPRFIEAEKARDIVTLIKGETGPQVTMVGIFVNESIDSLIRTAEVAALDAVQLHGDESPEYCLALTRDLSGRKLIKALRAHADFNAAEATRYPVDAVMLDAFHEKLRGGTGVTFDWELARATRELIPRLFLSGGLTPENVAEAISRVTPFAVDACSSLESAPGRKDHSRMKAFVQAGRSG